MAIKVPSTIPNVRDAPIGVGEGINLGNQFFPESRPVAQIESEGLSSPNEYESITAELAPDNTDNEYVDIVKHGALDQKAQLQQSMFVANQTDPERATKVRELSDRMKLPSNIVERNFDSLQKKDSLLSSDYDQIIQRTPELSKWLQDPNNAAVARDDIDGLGKVEDTVQDHWHLSNSISDLNSGIANLYSGIARVPALINDVGLLPINLALKAAGHPDEQMRSPDWLLNNPIATYFDRLSKESRSPDMDLSITEEISKGNYSRAGRALFSQFVANAPTQAAIIGGTISGFGIPALVGAGVLQAAQVNKESQASDVEPYAATANALTQGVAESLFERLGTFGILKTWESAIAKSFGKQASKEVIKDFAKTMVYSVAGDGNEEYWTQIVQDLSDYTTGVNPNALSGIFQRAADAGISGGFSGGLMTGPSAIASGVARGQQIKKSAMAKDFYLSMGSSTEATKLRERLPSAQKDYIDNLTKDSSVENVYIPIEAINTYFQEKKLLPAQVMQEIGASESYNEAIETGVDVKIPLAQWADKVVGTEHYAGLADNIKFNPGDLTINEAKTLPEIKPVVEEQASQIKDNIKSQLVATGKYSSADAEKQAQLHASIFKTLGERAGVDPLELFNKYGLNIKAAESAQSAGEKTLNQAPVFFHKIQQTVTDKMPVSASPDQVRGVIKDLKPEEIEWSGINEFLKGKEKVSKEDVLNFLRGNQLQIKETQLGGELPINATVQEGGPGFVVWENGQPTLAMGSTREAAIQQFNKHEIVNKTKFSKYTIPGGENYREVLFSLPQNIPTEVPAGFTLKENINAEKKYRFQVVNAEGRTSGAGPTPEMAISDYYKVYSPDNVYKSTHFSEPNIFAHTRLNDRVDSEGKKVLFIEEIQSDLHQEGRKKGYKLSAEEINKLKDELKTTRDSYIKLGEEGNDFTDEWDALGQKIGRLEFDIRNETKVPNAPFKKTWQEFVLKRLIREAAEKGYDKIAWTTGEQQVDRYINSIKTLKKVSYNETTGELTGLTEGGEKISEQVSKDKLGDYIGKPVAQSLLAKEAAKNGFKTITSSEMGDAIKAGGAHLRLEYDTQIPAFLNKFGKKYGAKVESSQIQSLKTHGGYYADFNINNKHTVFFSNPNDPESIPQQISLHNTRAQAREEASNLNAAIDYESKQKVHSLDLTSSLKEAALNEGFSLFQGGPNEPRGQIRFGSGHSFNIDLLKRADLSTAIHEMGHFYLEVLSDLSKAETATPELKEDFKIISDWVGSQDGKFTVDQHEQFARGFEAYLMTGKAPTSALRKAFASFKVWLTSVYRQLKNLNVELTPEVIGVFDRLVATDEEIKAAEVIQGLTPLFTNPESFGMSKAQTDRYIKAREEAREASEKELEAKLMKEVTREQNKINKSRRDKIEEEITAQINNTNLYKGIDRLRGSEEIQPGQPFKIGKDFVRDYKGKLPTGITDKNGLHPDVVAELLNFESGNQMLVEMANAPKKSEAIKLLTDNKMKELYPELLASTALKDEAMKAIHNDKRAELLIMELQHLASNNLPVLKDVIRRVVRRVPTEMEIRRQATQIIGSKNINEIRPYDFQLAEARSAKQAGEALAKGDIDSAFEFKRKELLNHELFRAANEAEESVEKSLKKFKKIAKTDEDLSKSRDLDIVNSARSILSRFGIGKFSDRSPESYLKAMKTYDEEAYHTISSLIEAVSENPKPYKDLTYDEFVDLKTSVDALWSLSKSQKEMEINGEKISRDIAIQSLSQKLFQIKGSKSEAKYKKAAGTWDNVKMKLLGMVSALRRVESWIDVIDNGNISGEFRKYIFAPISDSISRYRIKQNEAVSKFLALTKTIKFTNEPILSHELGYEFKGKAELLGMLLHVGNLSNKDKLIRGRGWDESKFNSFIERMHRENKLDKSDYDFVQGVWDLLETLKPSAQKAHKKMYGFYFNEITENPVVTPFGTYRGGYVPAIADPFIARDAQIRNEKELLEKFNNSFMFPTTGRGFTKSRVDAYAAPLLMDLKFIPGHIDKVLRFSEIEPHVKDVGKIVMNHEFRAVLDSFDPTVGGDMLVPWLQRSAQQRVTTPLQGEGGRALDIFFKEVRKRTGLNVMALNVSNALQNFTGLSIAAVKVKPKYLRNAIFDYSKAPNQMAQDVSEKSEFMKTRTGTQIFDIQKDLDDIILNPTKYEKAIEFAKEHGYVLQKMGQNIIDTITWTGAYNEAVSNGLTEMQAIKSADSVVRLTQGSFNAEDISRFESGTSITRAFTMFYSYFNMQANLLGSEFIKNSRNMGLKKGAGRALYIYTLGLMMPAVISEIIVRSLSGNFDEDDDDMYLDDYLTAFFMGQFNTVTSFIPVIGPTFRAGVNAFNNKWYDDRISTSPAVSAIESAVSAPASVYKAISGHGSSKKAIRDSATLLGLMTGAPAQFFAKPLGYLADDNKNPTGPIDVIRGLITGKGGK